MGKTVSFVGGDGNLNHNNRVFSTPNVDRSLTHQNVILKQQSLESAYDELFGESLQAYNDKQKRQDRKIDNYLAHVRESGNGQKPFYEYIAQVGNRDDTGIGSSDAAIAVQILKEFYEDFQKRNPNLYVFNAVIHLDESNGTPHMHLDFIPFARGYKKGMEVQTSMRKAMDQMGFRHLTKSNDDPDIHVSISNVPKWANVQWWSAERTVLGHLLESHGIEWEQADIHRENLSVSEYKAIQEAISKRVEQIPVAEVEFREAPVMLTKTNIIKADEIIVKRQDMDAVLQENAYLRTQAEIDRETIARMDKHKKEQDRFVQEALTNARSQTLQADTIKREFSSGTQEQYHILLSENTALKSEVKSLQVKYQSALCSEKEATTAKLQLRAEVDQMRKDEPLHIEKAVIDATEPLQDEIAELNKTVSKLQYNINLLCQMIKDCVSAIWYMFNQAPDNKYYIAPTRNAVKLFQSIGANVNAVLQKADPQFTENWLSPHLSNNIQKVLNHMNRKDRGDR